ncbi:hypothetical protein MS5935_11710 [Klebsiella pneumoniae]|nr:hypothetical protein MS5935_11710 [Klebsiella pneumoniae]
MISLHIGIISALYIAQIKIPPGGTGTRNNDYDRRENKQQFFSFLDLLAGNVFVSIKIVHDESYSIRLYTRETHVQEELRVIEAMETWAC